MPFNSATPKQRLRIAVVAFVVLLPTLLILNEVPIVLALSRSGEMLVGTIDRLVAEPTANHPYSTFHYEYNGIPHQGVARGVEGYRVGQAVTLTVRKDAPDIYWVGNAKKELWRQIAWSIFGALWLSVGAAFLVRLPWRDQ